MKHTNNRWKVDLIESTNKPSEINKYCIKIIYHGEFKGYARDHLGNGFHPLKVGKEIAEYLPEYYYVALQDCFTFEKEEKIFIGLQTNKY